MARPEVYASEGLKKCCCQCIVYALAGNIVSLTGSNFREREREREKVAIKHSVEFACSLNGNVKGLHFDVF